jgi:two-component sensor histidine kinase
MLKALLKWLNPQKRERWPTFWRVVLFWNPLICLIFTAVFNKYDGPAEYAFDLGISLVIGTTTIIICFVADFLVHWAEVAVLRSKGITPREHGIGWHLLVSGSGLPVGVYVGFIVAGGTFSFDPPGLRGLTYGIVLGVLVMLAFFLFETVGELREAKTLTELRSKEVENEKLRGQVAALTAQMNPHLLFNTLNTIASLTQSNPNAAEQTTVELADLYRGVLDAARKEAHSLADELSICRAYLSIEQARFGERLSFDVETDGVDPDALQLPPLLLQPLVENAVKHGLSPKAEGGRIRIEAGSQGEQSCIRVVDDGVGYGRAQVSNHESTALVNLRTRLELLHGSKASIEIVEPDEGGTMVVIAMPKVTT